MPLLRQQRRDLLVRLVFVGEFDDLVFHLLGAGQAGQGAHCYRQGRRRRGAPSPDNTDLNGVWSRAVNDNLVDQTAQEGLLLLGR